MNNPELYLLSTLLNKSCYNKYYSLLDIKDLKDTYRELSYIYSCLEELHRSVEIDLTLSDLIAYFWIKYPTAEKDIYEPLFKRLSDSEVSLPAADAIFAAMQRKQLLLAASEALYRCSSSGADISETLQTLQQLDNVGVGGSNGILTPLNTDLDWLLNEAISKPGLRWSLSCLNVSLGSLRAGDFGFIFARPETGKTTFLANAIASFLDQTDRPIVWFNNEEQGHKVVLRVYQAYFGVTLEQLIASRAKYRAQFSEATQGRFQFYDSAGISRSEAERIIDANNPALVVFDQIDKIKGFNADREDLRLGSIYQWAREGAKNRHAVIGVSQADGQAEGIKWLNMDHVSNAKTAKQAEADWILGIGKVHDPAAENSRYFNICKNKLFGDEDSNPELKHGKFEVLIQPQIARYKDIIDYG